MSLRSDQREDGENTSGSTEAKTDRYGFLLVNGDMNNDSSDDLSPELVRHREMKWINLMSQWDQVMEKKHSKIKAQCQKGIPASVRCKCWPLLCGATQRKENNKDLYNTLESSPGQQSWIDVIKRDTDRQFPFHEMFQSKDGHGQQGLLQVLKAYTQFRPDEGYCQAQGPVAAVLLMHMPMEEAFWCLVQISELYLPGYYSPLLEGVLFDAAVLFGVLKRTCPAAYKHLQRQGVEPLMFATDWLMCLYSRHLPFNTLLRVWDLFFCNGVRVLFQVAVVLVRRCLGEARQRKECEGQMETLERLRSVKGLVQHEQADVFIQEVCSVPLSLGELQRQTEKELQKWRKERPGSTFDPRDRCQGYYMIWEKGKERVKENEKERQSKNLKVPVMRSHSSLSPAILRKKWRKRGSKTETEEWEGRGFMKQGSGDEEKRRASVCGVAGELMAKTQKTPPEFSKHLECNTTVNRPCTAVTETQPDSELSDRNDTVFEEDENDVVVIAVPSHTDTGDHEEERKLPNSLKEDGLLAANSQQEIEKQHGTETWQDEEKKEQTPRDNQDEEISTHRDQQEPETQQEESQSSQLEEVEDARNKPEQEPQEINNKQEEETEIKTCNPEEKVQLKINTQEDDVEVQENTDKQEKPEQENETKSKREGKMRMDSSKNKQEIETNSHEQEEEIHLGSTKEEVIQLGKEKQTISSEEEVEIEEEKEIQTKRSEQEVEIQEEKEIQANSSEHEVENQEEKEIMANSSVQEEEIEKDKEIQANSNVQEEEIVTDKEIQANSSKHEVEIQEEKEIQAKSSEQEVEIQEENGIMANSSVQEEEIEKEKEIQANSSKHDVEIQEEKGIMANSSVQEEEIEKEKEIQANSSKHEVEIQEEKRIMANSSVQEEEIENDKEIHAKSCKQEMKIMEERADNREEEVEIENGDKEAHSANEEEKLKMCLIHTQDELQQQEDSTQKIEVRQIVEKEEETHSNVQTPEDQKDAEDRAPSVQEEEGHVKDECCGNESNKNVENTQQELEGERENEARISDAPVEETEGHVTDGEEGNSNSLTVDQAESETLVSSSCVQLERVIEHSGESETPRDSQWTQDENTEVNKMSTPEHVEPDRTSGSRNPEPPQPNKKEEEVEIEVNIPSNSNPQLRLRRSSSSHTSYPTILSGDTFRDPQQSIKRDSCHRTTEAEESDIAQPTQTQCSKQEDSQKPQTQSQSKSNKPKRRGLFQRLRADTPSKSTIPKIVIQDFSEGEEKMSSKERRRRRRMQERKEKEEDKERKKLEKELEKEKERERKKSHMRGKSFQALSRKHDDDEIFSERSGSPAVGRKRTSFSESYF